MEINNERMHFYIRALHFRCESRLFSTFGGVDIEPLVMSLFLTSPDCNTARTHPSIRVSIFNIDQILAELFQKNVSDFGCKIGGKIGQVTYS